MHLSTISYFRIFCRLLLRDLKIVKKRFVSTFIDGVVVSVSNMLIFGALLPTLGMPAHFIGPLYVGSMVSFLFWLGNTVALKQLFDLKGERLIDYHLILPLPKRWLFAEYIVYFMLESALIVAPLITLGLWFLSSYFHDMHITWWLLILMFILLLQFFGTFFLALGYYYNFDWYMNNVWPRRLSPMFSLSANFFIWKTVYSFSPIFGIILLFNPCTYLAEGLRNAIFMQGRFISWYICPIMALFFILLSTVLLRYGVYKRLDPV